MSLGLLEDLFLVYPLMRSYVDIGAHCRLVRGMLYRLMLPIELSVMSSSDTPLVIISLADLSHVIRCGDVLI
jgi:hypothetical protein